MSICFEDALKAKKLRNFFTEHGRIYIVVDASCDEVMVPDFLRGDAGLRLVLNSRMPQQIHIRDGFVESNFSFSGASHHCVIPMGSIWAAYLPDASLESGIVWEEDVPETIQLMMQAMDELGIDGEPDLKDQVISKDDSESIKKDPSAVAGRQVGHLRVVK